MRDSLPDIPLGTPEGSPESPLAQHVLPIAAFTPSGDILSRIARALEGPFFRTLVTINIEDDAIHLAIFRGRKVLRWRSLPLPPGLMQDGLISKPPEMGRLIRAFLARHRIRPRRLACSISGFHSMSRIINLPPLPKSAIPEAISRAAGREMPITPETTYLFFQLLKKTRSEHEFVVVATPRNVMDGLTATLREGKVTPRRMELKPLTLSRTVGTRGIAADIQAHSIDVSIVVGGVPLSFRTVSQEEATEEQPQVVVEEVVQTIDFFNTSHPQGSLPTDTPLFLTGPLSRDPATAEQLTAMLPHPHETPKVPFKYPAGFDPREYAVNLGLALGTIAPGKWSPGIAFSPNLLPAVFRPRHTARKAAAIVAGLLVAVSLLLPLYQLSIQAALQTDHTEARWYRLSEQLAVRKWTGKEAVRMKFALQEAIAQTSAFEQEWAAITALGTGHQRSLDIVFRATPPGLGLDSVVRSKGRMGIEGTADTYQAVITYLSALEESGGFSRIRIRNMAGTPAQDGRVTFALELTEAMKTP